MDIKSASGRRTLSAAAPPDSQYRDSARLAVRARLHARYSTIDWFDWVADRLHFAEGARVLDIGCGAGWFWAQAAPRLPAGLALTIADQSAGMVAEAVQRLSSVDRYAQVDGRVADAAALPFSTSSFDAVIAMHVLHHVPEPARAVDEMARVLRPGGRVVVTTNGRGNLGSIFSLASRAFGVPAMDPAVDALGIHEAASLLGRHFARVDVARFEDLYAISDPEDVFAYLTSLPPGIDAPAAQRDALRRLIAEDFAGGGTLQARRQAGLVVARGVIAGAPD